MLGALLAAQLQSATEGYCAHEGPCTMAPWARSEVGFHLGMHLAGTQYGTTRVVDPVVNLGVEGRVRPATGRGWDYLLFQGGAYVLDRTSPEGPASGLGGMLRVGLGFARFAFAVGVSLRGDFVDRAAVSALPSVVLTVRPGRWALTLAAFERPYGPMMRLGFEYGSFGISYVPLYGAELWGRFALNAQRSVALELRAFGYSFGPLFSAGLNVGVVLGDAPTYRFGGAR